MYRISNLQRKFSHFLPFILVFRCSGISINKRVLNVHVNYFIYTFSTHPFRLNSRKMEKKRWKKRIKNSDKNQYHNEKGLNAHTMAISIQIFLKPNMALTYYLTHQNDRHLCSLRHFSDSVVSTITLVARGKKRAHTNNIQQRNQHELVTRWLFHHFCLPNHISSCVFFFIVIMRKTLKENI